jgi:hypothetical protein
MCHVVNRNASDPHRLAATPTFDTTIRVRPTAGLSKNTGTARPEGLADPS